MATSVSSTKPSTVSSHINTRQNSASHFSTVSKKETMQGGATVANLQSSFTDDIHISSNTQYPMQQATVKLQNSVSLSKASISTTTFSSVTGKNDMKTDFDSSGSVTHTATGTNQNDGVKSLEISKTESVPFHQIVTQTLTKFTSDKLSSESKEDIKSSRVLNMKQSHSVSTKHDQSSLSDSKSLDSGGSDLTSYRDLGVAEPSSYSFTNVHDINYFYSSTLGELDYYPEISQTESATDFIKPSKTPDIRTSEKVAVEFSGSSEFYSHLHSQSANLDFPDFQNLSGETFQTVLPTETTSASVPVTGPKISSSKPPPPPVVPFSPLPTPSGDGNGTSVSSNATPALFANNYPLVIGISLCGAGVLIFLLILIVVCCRKRKPKKEKHANTQAQDLWMNTHGDISLSPALDSVQTFESVSEPGVDTINKTSKTNGSKPAKKSKKQKIPKKIKTKSGGQVQNQCKALHPFKPTLNGQLAVERGDIITIIQKDENGWWKGSIGDRIGWFPGSFVQEIDPTSGKKIESGKTNQTEPAAVSSFLLSKDKKKAPKVPTRGDQNINRYSDSRLPQKLALGKEVPIPTVPKLALQDEKRNTDVKIDLEVPTAKPHFEQNIEGKKFKALYSYVSNFKEELDIVAGEIITGIERDRNGWMKGRKKSGEEGWVPSVYMEEIATSPRHPQQVYDQLSGNRSEDTSQDLVGIVHKATCPYAAERPEDLSFDIGDTIVVFDTLENGWWLGCRGEDVGWFPGTYVELVEEEIPEVVVEVPSSDNNMKPVVTNSTFDDYVASLPLKSDSVMSDNCLPISPLKSDISELSAYKSDDEHSVSSASTVDSKKSAGSRPRPARKAPAPPTGDSTKGPSHTGSKIPRFGNTPPQSVKKELLPVSPINTTLSTSTVDSERDTESVFSVSELSKSEIVNEIKVKDSPSEKPPLAKKPELPKRFVKPKLIRLPRQSNNMKYIADRSNQKAKSPPPPRPDPPKYLPRSQHKVVEENKDVPNNLKENTINDVKVEPKPRSKIPKLSKEDSTENPNVQINVLESSTDRKVREAFMESFGENNSESFNISGVNSFISDNSFNENDNKTESCSSFKTPPKENDIPIYSKISKPKSKVVQPSYRQDIPSSDTNDETLPEKNRKNVLDTAGVNLNLTDDTNENLTVDKHEPTIPNTESKNANTPEKSSKISRIPKFPRQMSQTSNQKPEIDKIGDNHQENENLESEKQTRIPSVSKTSSDKSKTTDDINIDQSDINCHVDVEMEKTEIPKSMADQKEPLPSPKKVSKIPQSPKQSRLPKFRMEKKRDKSLEKLDDKKQTFSREASPSAQKPPLAPKPKVIPVPKVYYKGLKDYRSDHSDTQLDSSADELDEIQGSNKSEISPKQNMVVENASENNQTVFPIETERTTVEHGATSHVDSKVSPVETKTNIPVISKSAKKSPTQKSKISHIPMSSGRKPVAKKRNKNTPSESETSPARRKVEPLNGKTSRSSSLSDDGSSAKTKPKRPDKPPSSRSSSQSDDGMSSAKQKPSRPDKPPEDKKSKIPFKSKTSEHSPSQLPTFHSFQGTPSTTGQGEGQSVSPERKSRSRAKGGSSIPLMKPARPPPPRSLSPESKPDTLNHEITEMNDNMDDVDRLPRIKKKLRRAARSYHAQNDDELSFNEGSFIKEIEDCEDSDNTKWRVGMLADGTIGLFHMDFVEESPAQKQSVV